MEEDTAVRALAGVVDADTAAAASSDSASGALQQQTEKFYTHASDLLVALRNQLAPRTFEAASARLRKEADAKKRRLAGADASECVFRCVLRFIHR